MTWSLMNEFQCGAPEPPNARDGSQKRFGELLACGGARGSCAASTPEVGVRHRNPARVSEHGGPFTKGAPDETPLGPLLSTRVSLKREELSHARRRAVLYLGGWFLPK